MKFIKEYIKEIIEMWKGEIAFKIIVCIFILCLIAGLWVFITLL